MEKLTIFLFDIGLWSVYLMLALVVGLLIQLISYRVFGFNLYKWLNHNLIMRWL